MVTPGLRWFLRVAAALALIAGVLLFPLASETDRFFSWTIEPPLTAAFLGAAYWAACVLLASAAREPTWARVRPVLPPVFVIAVLLLVATLIRLDKFHLDSLFGWFWLVTYIVVPPLLAYLVVQQVRAAGPVAPGEHAVPRVLRGLLAVEGALLFALGSALYLFPSGADDLWPWVLSPLTAEAIGAFLVGFGVAAGWALLDDGLDRLRGSALAYVALGALQLAALAVYSDDFDAGGAAVAAYVVCCAIVMATGAYGLIARSAASRSS